MREIAQDYKDVRFRASSIQAIQEAAENFVVETFHKSEMARQHAKRKTVQVEDIRFSRFMTPDSLWVFPDRIWEKETFSTCNESKLDKKVPGPKKALPVAVQSRDAKAIAPASDGGKDEEGKESADAGAKKASAKGSKNKRKQSEPSRLPRKDDQDPSKKKGATKLPDAAEDEDEEEVSDNEEGEEASASSSVSGEHCGSK